MLLKIEEMKLIAQVVISDNRRAFAALVDEYHPQVRGFLLNLTAGDDALADDLAQETFIKVYVNIRSYQGISKFSTWVIKIAYNEYCSYMRKYRDERADEIESQPMMSSEGENSADCRMDVYAAMKTLSAAERTVITLFYIQDLPIKKIVEITGMKEGTVKSHISRGKEKMQSLLR